MNALLNNVPKPVIVFVVLCAAVIFFVLNDPPKDECEIQATVFDRNTKGLIKGTVIKKKRQFPLIDAMKEKCRSGNSPGACNEYFEALGKIVAESRMMSDKCVLKYIEEFPALQSQMIQGLQIMSLVAWGDKPPESLGERVGWLNEGHVRTFCRLKKSVLMLVTEEEYVGLRNRIYREYPDHWADKAMTNDGFDNRLAEDRPRALRTASNPKGRLDSKEIFEKSLFSIPCQMFQ